MTSQKSFKTRTRARMDATGERYTTARRRLLDKSDRPPVAAPDAEPPAADLPIADLPIAAPPAAPAAPTTEAIKANKLASTSLRARTGHDREQWFALLDRWGATGRTHTEIARWLVDKYGVEGWWSQNITVAYEQERGMRAPGQKCDGYFSVTGSKTVAVTVERLFEAFADTDLREQWLPARFKIRTATAGKSLRADWQDGLTRIAVGFTAKTDGKAQVALQHEKLPDAQAAAQLKTFWRERLSVLKELLES